MSCVFRCTWSTVVFLCLWVFFIAILSPLMRQYFTNALITTTLMHMLSSYDVLCVVLVWGRGLSLVLLMGQIRMVFNYTWKRGEVGGGDWK